MTPLRADSFDDDMDSERWLKKLKPLPWVFARELAETGVQVEDRVRKSVVYVGLVGGADFVPLGTGFLTFIEVDDLIYPVLVTARHVVEGVKEGPSTTLGIRINLRGQGAHFIPTPLGNWKAHPDSNSDLAFFQIAPDKSIYDYLLMPCDGPTLDKVRDVFPPMLGREVFIAGLYTSHFGAARNIPIIRVGHIALLPDEPVKTPSGYTRGYLIEMRSIAGLSGSPVFIKRPRLVVEGPENDLNMYENEMIYPLGVLVGHHVVETREDEIPVPREQGRPGAPIERLEDRNTGFGVVIPIERVTEDLYSEETFAAIRSGKKEVVTFREDKMSPTTDIDQRRDAALANALRTRPKPRSPKAV